MSRRRLFALTLTTFAIAASAALASQESRGILFRELFPPTKGTYEAPAGQLGEKPDQPWSTTTVAAGVDSKPLQGKVVTIPGEIIDYSCYLQVGKHGDKHRDCGQKCLRNGQPIGLLAEDGSIYLLMEEEHNPRRDGLTDLRSAAIEHMAHIMQVSGTMTTLHGQRAIFVTGFVKK